MFKFKFKKGYVSVYGNTIPIRIAQFFASNNKEVRAVAWPPFICFKKEEYELPWIVNHELIHFRQIFELFFIGAIFLSVFERLYARLFLGLSLYETYIYSSLEQEAYLNHNNLDYLKTRKIFTVLKYIKIKKKFSINGGGVVSNRDISL